MTYETNATAHEVTDRIPSLARKEHQVSTQAEDGKKVVWKLDASTRYNLGVVKNYALVFCHVAEVASFVVFRPVVILVPDDF